MYTHLEFNHKIHKYNDDSNSFTNNNLSVFLNSFFLNKNGSDIITTKL